MFTRDTPGSRSLARGLLLLRAFRTGITAVSNAEFAAFSGLPRSTVSRLTRTLVDAGFLDYHSATSTYRLGPPLLTLGANARRTSDVLRLALPRMRRLADQLMVNVGLAVAALGRAWLAGIGTEERERALQQLSARYGSRWKPLESAIGSSVAQVRALGWCDVNYRKGELTSIAMPLTFDGLRVHALNLSYPETSASHQERYAKSLLNLGKELMDSFAAREGAASG
ncbi:MAG: helix-turn-helix domain-containing protein [Rhodocyclaceae bacterium]|nr:helix-turn-helix domain-containing protein [Rhodocyclaceae bacterium]